MSAPYKPIERPRRCRYWKFTASKRWDQQKHKKPSSSAPQPPRPTGAPQAALQEQLAGLRRKAAYRRVNQRSPSETAPQGGVACAQAVIASSAVLAHPYFYIQISY